MSRFVVLFAFACAGVTPLQQVAAQHQNPHAKILADSRYLSNNGQFGAAYSQDDGVDFKEETDAAGNRRGSYSYLDPSGQKRTVSYTAGKDGFKAVGDHLPTAPEAAPTAPAAPSPWQNQWSQPPAAAQNQWNSAPVAAQNQPQWNSAPAARSQWNSAPAAAQNQWNQWNSAPAAAQNQWNSAPAVARSQWNSAPAKAEDGEWVPDNEAAKFDDGSYRSEYEDPNYDQKTAASPQWNSAPSNGNGQWNQWNSAPTPAPYYGNHASGKINLNRSPDGFSYTYTQN